MTPTGTSLTQSFADLETLVQRSPGLRVRVQLADGTSIEGQDLDVAPTELWLLDAVTRKQIHVGANELRAIDVRMPRRGREWMLAVGAILGVTAALIGYAHLPWVQPEQGDITMGAVILVALGAGYMSMPIAHPRLQSWLTRWERVYAAAAPSEEQGALDRH